MWKILFVIVDRLWKKKLEKIITEVKHGRPLNSRNQVAEELNTIK